MNSWEDARKQIRATREERGYSVEQFARLCKVGKGTISRIENGTRRPSVALFFKLCEVLGCELRFLDTSQSLIGTVHKNLWVQATREEAYAQVCTLLRARKVQQIDLLQFSGVTAMPVLKELARCYRDARIRLLLVSQEVANAYDEHGFHWNRVQSTLTECQLLKENYPTVTIDVWFYTTPPTIAGIVVDDWMVSAGWYRVFAREDLLETFSLRGHNLPAITAVDEEVEPLLSMVRNQFNAVKPANPPLRWYSR